jgi:nitroreductase
MEKAALFDQIVTERRAIRVYDSNKTMPDHVVENSLKRATLAPSSSNMMLYEFYRVRKKEDLEQLAFYCLGQSTAKTAHEMVIVVVRGDMYKHRANFNYSQLEKLKPTLTEKRWEQVKTYYTKVMPMYYNTGYLGAWGWMKKGIQWVTGWRKPVVRQTGNSDIRTVLHKSAALAAQTFMLSVKAEGFDTCPMEGVDSLRIKKWLNLPRKAEINMVISVGPSKLPDGIYNPRIRVPQDQQIFTL